MTRQEFLTLCEQYAIHPSVALENDDLVAAIKGGDKAEVERILSEEF